VKLVVKTFTEVNWGADVPFMMFSFPRLGWKDKVTFTSGTRNGWDWERDEQ